VVIRDYNNLKGWAVSGKERKYGSRCPGENGEG